MSERRRGGKSRGPRHGALAHCTCNTTLLGCSQCSSRVLPTSLGTHRQSRCHSASSLDGLRECGITVLLAGAVSSGLPCCCRRCTNTHCVGYHLRRPPCDLDGNEALAPRRFLGLYEVVSLPATLQAAGCRRDVRGRWVLDPTHPSSPTSGNSRGKRRGNELNRVGEAQPPYCVLCVSESPSRPSGRGGSVLWEEGMSIVTLSTRLNASGVQHVKELQNARMMRLLRRGHHETLRQSLCSISIVLKRVAALLECSSGAAIQSLHGPATSEHSDQTTARLSLLKAGPL